MGLLSREEKKIRVIVIGGGISGIGQAIRLKERLGDRLELTVYERDPEAGGVWYRALWPGAGVDVPIHWYALYSDPNPNWNKRFAERNEVFYYWQGLIQKYNIRDNFQFNTIFVSSWWNEETHTHTVKLQRKGGKEFEIETDFLISATGPLSTPITPNIPGLETFEGASFHNLRWDPNVVLEDKRIAVVGNGSSGVQMVPGLSQIPGVNLTHFIRSGGFFVPKVNTSYTPLAKWGFRWLPGLRLGHRLQIFLQFYNFPAKDKEKAEKDLLAYLRAKAPEEYIDALLPTYPLGCKRTALDAGWLESLHKPNVSLTNSKIVSADATGLNTADGKHHKLDVIVFATGAAVPTLGLGLSQKVYGTAGQELSQVWKSKGGPEAYRSIAVPSVPNYFIVLGPNGMSGAWGHSSALETAAIARIIGEVFENGGTYIAPKEEVTARESDRTQELLRVTPAASTACSNWYRAKIGGKLVHQAAYKPCKRPIQFTTVIPR
ncbi:hypothetical protein MNV49_004567 [Pseudohyphozyma bogoriensis]|nr:hypothetical protein MNV49_004567 [Pseudohyphozyma bogoriensis]